MKNKNLAQILKPIAAPQFQQQRKHIYSQFKKMLARGMSRKMALQYAQFNVDSLTGNNTKISEFGNLNVVNAAFTPKITTQIQRAFYSFRERVAWRFCADKTAFQAA